MWQRYEYQGDPIEDIEAWAAKRGEKMIDYERTIAVADMLTGKIHKRKERGAMPSTFFGSLRIQSFETYRVISEREPGQNKKQQEAE